MPAITTATMGILVTEVTNMHNGHVCVGGWCAAQGRMVRPLSGPRAHWGEALARSEFFEVGNLLDVTPSGQPSPRQPPHSREDCILAGTPHRVGVVAPADLPGALAPSESASVADLFGGHLEASRWVMAGADCPSLGAVRTSARRLGFKEKVRPNGTKQLRCWFYDSPNDSYDLPVASRALQATHVAHGLEALNAVKQGKLWVHIRIGLAHPFDDGRAFAMVNHVLYF